MLGINFDDPVFGDLVASEGPSFRSSLHSSSFVQDETLKISENISKVNLTYSSSSFQTNILNKLESKENIAKTIKQRDIFKCKCSQKQLQKCMICHGEKQITGENHFVKFLEYIVDFKLGLKESYQNGKWGVTSTPLVCRSSLRNQQKKQQIQRYSVGSSCKKVTESTIVQKCQKSKYEHEGYDCDSCQADPIKGPRHHCLICQNFDLCQKCYYQVGHQHPMRQIAVPKLYYQMNGLVNLLTMSQRVKKSPPIDSGIRTTSKSFSNKRETL